MDILDLQIESQFTRGFHLPPDTPLKDNDAIMNCYEIILFPEDFDGGVVVGNTFHQTVSGYFVFCKPGQARKFRLPVRCFMLNFSTRDPQLKAALDKLPTYARAPNMPELMELYWKIYYIPTHTDLPDRLALYMHFAEFLRQLLQNEYPLGTIAPANPRRHWEALLAADQYLKDHLEEDVDLEQLAAASHLHPTYFHKLFTEAFGKSPAQQLMLYRIRAAWEYLRRDDCTIAEIARKCGFSSQSYFCRKYKEISKETPSSYRNAMRRLRKKEAAKK